MLSELKPKLNPVITTVAKPFSSVDPNILTLLGLVPPFIFLILMLNHLYGWALVSFLGLFLDTLDGAVARMTSKTTAFGGLLDSTLDRVADSIFIFAFVFAGIVNIELAFIVLLLSFLISYIRSRAELAAKGGFVLNVGWIERPERLIFLFAALLSFIVSPQFQFQGINGPVWVFIILSILSIITVFQRFAHSWDYLKGK